MAGDQEKDARVGEKVLENMSVDSTNELRKKLGLKPLNVVSKEEMAQRKAEAEKQRKDSIIAAEKKAENDEIRERLAKRKKKRLLNKKIKGKSLGESLAKATGGSAADWIKRSRMIESKKKEAADRFNELDAEEEAASYTEKDLKGLKVSHNLEDFREGSNVILTLKDAPLITGHFDDAKLNDDEDVLANPEMELNEKYEKLNEAKSKMLKPKYDVFGDNPNQGLLPQYDEEDVMNRQKDGMRIGGDEPDSEEERQQRAARVRERLKKKSIKGVAGGKIKYDLNAQSRVQTDYKKPEEVKFKKRKKKSKDGKKRKRKIRASKAIDFLPEPSDADRQKHHGSRSAGNTQLAKRQAEERALSKKEADANYLRALNKEESKAFIMPQPADDEEEELEYEDKFDIQLQAALSRAREIGAKKRTRTKDKKDKTAELAKAALAVPKDEPVVKVEDGKESDGIILSSTSEFCRGLEDVVVEEKKSKMDIVDKEAMHVEDDEDDEDDDKKDEDMDIEDGEEEEEQEEDDNVDFLHDEPLASGGMAAVLNLAKKRGLLNDPEARKKSNDPAPNLQLEYPDEYGRPMTAKEAYRKLSHAFHGKAPGKMKNEKRIKKYLEDLKSKKIGNIDDPSHTISKLKARQKASGKAFLVLDQKLTAEDREKLVKEAQKLARKKRRKQKKKERAAKAAAKRQKVKV